MSAHSEWSTLLPASAKDSEKDFFCVCGVCVCACVMLVRHVKQFYSKRLKLLF